MSILNWTDNAPAVELTAPVGATDTDFYVSTSGGYPATPFEFAIDLGSAPELVLCENIVSNTHWTVQRGWDNSTAQIHNPKAGQIVIITSEGFWAEVNAHLTQDPPDHVQYMRTDGTRHDDPAKHTVGTGEFVAINTESDWDIQGSTELQAASYVLRNRFSQLYLASQVFDPTKPPISHWDDTAFKGYSKYPANGLHVHPRESHDELEGHLWPPGTLALWGGPTVPPGWLPADGRDVRTDLAPLAFEQWGYTCGSAIDWYPAPPVLPSYIAYKSQSYTDPATGTPLVLDVPYSYVQDPRTIAMQLPAGHPTYFKLPHLAPPYKGLTWIVKMDYGYTWQPRPLPPPSLPIYCSPFAADALFPSVTITNVWQSLGNNPYYGQQGPEFQQVPIISEPPHPPGTYKTKLTWGFDAVSGLPVILGNDYIGPGQPVSGPIAVPVYPYGQPIPQGFSLLHPPQPPYEVGPPIVVDEELVQLYSVRVNVVNGYGWLLTTVPWTSLASPPWCNASYPPVDKAYWPGIAQAQDRGNQVAITVSKMTTSNPGQPDQPWTGSVVVYFFVYSTA